MHKSTQSVLLELQRMNKVPSSENELTGVTKINAKEHRQMLESYKLYLAGEKKEGTPREAHIFALATKHKGVTFGKSVAAIVIELEGSLPAYWPQD
jgi:hypothetical protein